MLAFATDLHTCNIGGPVAVLISVGLSAVPLAFEIGPTGQPVAHRQIQHGGSLTARKQSILYRRPIAAKCRF